MGYRGKTEEQHRARLLRADGWTLGEISEELGVSKASASLWCREVQIDAAALAERRRARHLDGNRSARQRGPNKLQRRKQLEIEEADDRGRRIIAELSDRDVLMAALALYAGEGAKADGCVKFANTNARMVRLFLAWLRAGFEIDEARLRLQLYLHEGLDLAVATSFWSEATGIPASQFTKPYRAVADPSIRRSKHPMGCAAVSYSCSTTHRRLMGMVRALLESFDSGASQGDLGPLPG